jgi:hypothetical protein
VNPGCLVLVPSPFLLALAPAVLAAYRQCLSFSFLTSTSKLTLRLVEGSACLSVQIFCQ